MYHCKEPFAQTSMSCTDHDALQLVPMHNPWSRSLCRLFRCPLHSYWIWATISLKEKELLATAGMDALVSSISYCISTGGVLHSLVALFSRP